MVTPSKDEVAEALERFGIAKRANWTSTIPAVALPALGAYAGGRLLHNQDLGRVLGGITGGVAGQAAKETLDRPMPAPYAMDQTMQDIPPWALAGAQFFGPAIKAAGAWDDARNFFGGHEFKDVVIGDTLGPIHPIIEGVQNKNLGGAVKGIAGQSAGVAGGGLLGMGAGKLISRALGHDVTVPLTGGLPLSTILGGLGATIGGVHGLNWARGGK